MLSSAASKYSILEMRHRIESAAQQTSLTDNQCKQSIEFSSPQISEVLFTLAELLTPNFHNSLGIPLPIVRPQIAAMLIAAAAKSIIQIPPAYRKNGPASRPLAISFQPGNGRIRP